MNGNERGVGKCLRGHVITDLLQFDLLLCRIITE